MEHRLVGAVSACLIAAALAACSTAPEKQVFTDACPMMTTTGPDVEEIRRLEERGAKVNVEGWTIEEAREFFAPEWLSAQPDGTDSGLETVFGAFQNGRSAPWAGRFEITDLDIRVYCDVAIAFGRADAYRPGAAVDQAQPDIRFRWLNVWRKAEGRWVYAANQFTRY